MNSPDISVVMSVYNGAASIEKTILSILEQKGIDLEFIIVNDGSNDECQSILESLSKSDRRIVLISQPNRGLTKSLISACGRARGRFIARQDNGDVSLANRLKSQLQYLDANPSCSMLSCSTRFISPRGEELYCVAQTALEAKYGLKKLTVSELVGPPHHGSVMFSTETYKLVGGYRSEFIVAQDIDLWSRMVEAGEHHSLQDVFYTAIVAKNSISMLRRGLQMQATQTIIECAQARSLTGNDNVPLAAYASKQKFIQATGSNYRTDSDYYYFLGSNLARSDTLASSRYFRLATQSYPLHWKAWIKRAINGAKSMVVDILKK